ncbi:MAG: FHA domain-containing protein [Bacteroidota bacterium]
MKSVSAEAIVDQFVQLMHEASQTLPYTIRVPNYFVAVLHPDDYRALAGLKSAIIEEAERRLDEELARLNGTAEASDKPASKLKQWLTAAPSAQSAKTYVRTGSRWDIDLDEDLEGQLEQRGQFDIHVEHVDAPASPSVTHVATGNPTQKINLGMGGSGTTGPLTKRITLGTPAAPSPDTGSTGPSASMNASPVVARLRYTDKTGERLYEMRKPTIAVGRGGSGVEVDVALNASKAISRRHCEIRQTASGFELKDVSTYGTKIDGTPVPSAIDDYGEERDTWVVLPSRCMLLLADELVVRFDGA